jgi:hypothetical protein
VIDLSVFATSIGPAEVLHRLALGVEPHDAVTRAPVSTAVRVGQEVPPRMRTRTARFEEGWPCLDFETNGTARFKLRHQIGGPNRIKVDPGGAAPTITVRIEDFRRRFVPRRFRIPLWAKRELERADNTPPTGQYVLVASRLLRPFLFPGATYTVPRGTTAIRGRIVSIAGRVVRWPRVFAEGPGNIPVGAAHGDERGEFLLIVTNLGTTPPPVPSAVDVDLDIFARAPAPAFDPKDRLADLVVESQARSPVPPTNANLDNDVLRGVAIPPGYVASTEPRPHLTIPLGGLLTMSQPVVFTP